MMNEKPEHAKEAVELHPVVRPHRRHRLEIVIESDDDGKLMDELQEITCQLELGQVGPVIMGGCDSSFHFHLTEDKTMTAELYKEKLNQYLENADEV